MEERVRCCQGRRRTRGVRGAAIPCVVALALFAFGCSDEVAAPVSKPIAVGDYAGRNIVIVSVDTLRADHLGVYGYARDTSPRLDRLAAESVLFERARAPRGLTWPSLIIDWGVGIHAAVCRNPLCEACHAPVRSCATTVQDVA